MAQNHRRSRSTATRGSSGKVTNLEDNPPIEVTHCPYEGLKNHLSHHPHSQVDQCIAILETTITNNDKIDRNKVNLLHRSFYNRYVTEVGDFNAFFFFFIHEGFHCIT